MTPVLRYDINKITVSRSAICSHSLSFDAQRPVSGLKEPNIRRVCSDLHSAVHLHLSGSCQPGVFSYVVRLLVSRHLSHAPAVNRPCGMAVLPQTETVMQARARKPAALRLLGFGRVGFREKRSGNGSRCQWVNYACSPRWRYQANIYC